jgi:hypothetical protein
MNLGMPGIGKRTKDPWKLAEDAHEGGSLQIFATPSTFSKSDKPRNLQTTALAWEVAKPNAK